jgi:hypothetical protein
MPVEQLSSRPAKKPASDGQIVEYDRYIDTQIRQTRRAVKIVDLVTTLVMLAAGVLAFLLVVAVAEHWLVPGGFSVAARTILFGVLVGGIGYVAFRRLLPLVLRAVNPVYAANAIEQHSPSLKNTLVNFLLFRQNRFEIPDAVYKTLEEQAARRLAQVQVDTSVDSSSLIRFGYVLIAVVAVAALYKVLSPKDPFISAERILFPWTNVVPASRVSISQITPGSVTVSRGESVDVSAEVHGIDENDSVLLRYTTDDGQIADKAISLKPGRGGLRFEGRLPDEPQNAQKVGLTQSVTYRLEAGDARSLDYAVKVVESPSILVERVDYDYPDYTGYVDRQVDGAGDIRAIEGTKITIHARANGAIREAHVDFDADGRNDLNMSATDMAAKAEFVLGLREDRQTPLHPSYVLRLINREGRPNREPVKHSINVDPDRSPEVSIIAPREKQLDVRLDDKVEIEVDANDPDFALSAVKLKGEAVARPPLDERLLNAVRRGRFHARYAFTPSAHKLQAGDVVTYWVEASDNRTPKPNVAKSEVKTFRIVSPNPPQQPPANQIAQNDRQQRPPNDQQPGGDQGQGKNQGQNGKGDVAGNAGRNGKQQPDAGGQQKNGQQQNQNQGQSGNGDSSGNASANDKQQPNAGGQQKNGQQQNQDRNGKNDSSGNAGKKDQQQPGAGGQGQAGKDDQQSKGEQQPQNGGGGASQNAAKPDQQQRSGENQKGNEGAANKSDSAGQQNGKSQNGGQGQAGKQEAGNQKQSDQKSSDGKQTDEGATGGQSSKDGRQPDGGKPDSKNQPQQGSRDSQTAKQSGEAKASDTPVSSHGDNDADAFQRIERRMQESGELKENQNKENQNNENQNKSSNDKNDSRDPGGQGERSAGSEQKQGAEQRQGDRQRQGNEQRQGDKGTGRQGEQDKNSQKQNASTEKQPGEPGATTSDAVPANGEKAEQNKQDAQKNQQNAKPNASDKPGERANDQGKGGAETRGDDSKQPKEPNSEQNSQEKSPGGQQTAAKGESGAGKEQKPQGAPNSKPNMKPAEKREQQPSKNERSNKEEPPAADGQSKKESDSQGDQGGDKSGGGEEGGGQKAPREGTGSAGQHQSADNGAGESGEQGTGNNSPNAGKDGVSDKKTGQPGDQTQGKGTGQRGGQGDKPGAAPGGKDDNRDMKSAEQSAQQQAKQDKETGRQGDKEKQTPQNNGAKNNDDKGNDPTSRGGGTGGGGQGGAAAQPTPVNGTAPDGDAANLEYAKKQTDLVLEKLSDQLNRKKVDQQLLKDLGWTEDDLKRFVDRWRQRKAAADRNDESGDAAKRELDEALKSLGLRPGTLHQNAAKKDTLRDLHEGYRGPVPRQYQDRLRAYNEGVSRAHRDGE